jgi:hypothetical protein
LTQGHRVCSITWRGVHRGRGQSRPRKKW